MTFTPGRWSSAPVTHTANAAPAVRARWIRMAFSAAAIAAALATSGCTAQPVQGPPSVNGVRQAPSEADARALAQLAEIAPAGAEIDGDVTETECWAPSEHLLSAQDGGNGSTFRVLCRVHYVEANANRFRDMICVGDVETDPVADQCYRWAYYTDVPSYDDQRGYEAQKSDTA